MSIDPQRLKELFLNAAEIKTPTERAAFLQRECGDDAELRRKLEALLHAHDDAGSFLAPGPTSDPRPTGDEHPHVESSDAAGDVIGPYKLLQKLGEGGMGAVWVAEQHQPVKRRVALKLIKSGMDSRQVLRRFEAERQALALMDHFSIAKVFDAGTTPQGRPYFVMELVHGVPITKYCNELNLPIRERLALFVPVCQAIQHAHQKGIIHRDIKPSNVLVCMQDGKPVPKIIDFGVAKATSQRLTEASMFTEFGAVVGTLEYMAPEQAEMSPLGVDTRADVYALGALLYELLTGTTPLDRKRLQGAALVEMLRIIKEDEPPRPSTRLSQSKVTLGSVAALRRTEPARLMKEVRGELDWIVMKCLEKDRTRRYETANALARDVERYLADEPVEACPPSRSYRLGKFARKYRAAMSAAAAFVLLLAIAAAVSAALAVRARQAEALAEARLEEVSKEKARADEEGRIAAAVNEFLQKQLLGQADIGNQPLLAGAATDRNPNVTVRELLDRAARDINSKFAGQPVTEASIRLTMGTAYRALGRYPEAQQHLERALQLRTATLGTGHPDTLTSKSELGELYLSQGQHTKAEPLIKEVLEGRTAKLGTDHPETLISKSNLASLYKDQGQYAKAEPLFKEALEGHTTKLGADHPDTLLSKNNLATLYEAQGQYTKAETLLKDALEAQTTKLGADHPETLVSKSNLAYVYTQQGQYAKAEPLLKDALAALTAKLGTDHPQTLHSKDFLAQLYYAQGLYAKAEPLFKEALDGRTAKLGADHPATLTTKNNLAAIYEDQGQYAKAEPLLKEALEGQTAKRGADHPHTLMVKNNLAQLYQAQGQYAKAETLLRELLASWRGKAGADSLPYANQLAILASNLLLQHKAADAEPMLRECLAIRQNKQPDVWTTFNAQSLLGNALMGQKKYTDAEPLLKEGYQGMKQRQDKIPSQAKVRLREALERLMQLYEATDNKDEAAKWRKELQSLQAKSPEARHDR